MKSEALSQSEVESLLHSVADGQEPGRETADRNEPQPPLPQALYEDLGRNLSATLSEMLRTEVDIRPAGADRFAFGEFLRSLENPTHISLFKAEPLEGNLALEIRPSILYPMIDRLLGGRDTGTPHERPLTEIELRLASRITGVFRDELHRVWENTLDSPPESIQVESDPQKMQLTAPGAAAVVIRFELIMDQVTGSINLCIPCKWIEQVSDQAAGAPEGFPSINDSMVEIEVSLAQTQISTSDLADLRIGDIITTEQRIDGPLTVTVDGVPKYHARPGTFEGHKAICIEGEVDGEQSTEDGE